MKVKAFSNDDITLIRDVLRAWLDTYDDSGAFAPVEYPELWEQIPRVRALLERMTP